VTGDEVVAAEAFVPGSDAVEVHIPCFQLGLVQVDDGADQPRGAQQQLR
jgi:hypothetical protein